MTDDHPALRRIPAEEVDPARHRYVNRPGRTPYVFDIHRVVPVAGGRLRIDYGATFVVCRPEQTVLVTGRIGDCG